ncbi:MULTISPECIES: hypothetical protein [unclassified Lentimicrobium]|uniref:hypothetical protein n=1 Tax=unclassified Lentimicrobium TaxID=2677434 RepID=UPI0015520F4B|nr:MULTISPECIES: hypothetical protein [unclassified Lentimicrobium]NPD48214.1 hypothetical protein [Lentimicrobium sp. S6]NPD87002.1 hypothetical protein [Lentimicrobium sp. L6]
MIQNIFIKESSKTKIIILGFVFFLLSGSAYSQCSSVIDDKDLKINNTYSLDSLFVSNKITNVLEHSISLIDTLYNDQKDTWLYFVFCMSSVYNNQEGVTIKIELQQGVSYNVFYDRLIDEGECFSGAFCYKGYSFFVLSDSINSDLYQTFFSSESVSNFPIYYNKPEPSVEWGKLGYHDINKFSYLFYKYNEDGFRYVSTTFCN